MSSGRTRQRYSGGPAYDPAEKQWMADVIEVAQLYGWTVYHTHDSRRSASGFPDLILIQGRYLLAVELKSRTGRVRPEQQRWLEMFSQVREVRAAVWRPQGRQRVYDDLRRFAADSAHRPGELVDDEASCDASRLS